MVTSRLPDGWSYTASHGERCTWCGESVRDGVYFWDRQRVCCKCHQQACELSRARLEEELRREAASMRRVLWWCALFAAMVYGAAFFLIARGM